MKGHYTERMKQIEFQHFKKAPHPFEQYGNLPPAALNNRSIPQDYSSLPQGQEAFINKGGKKQYENRHQSSIKQHWLGLNQNDSLSKEMKKQNHKVFGKSLETKDIQGAQGGSLKSPAVKYKQKAQQLKMNGKLNGFDHYENEKEEYKLKIQNALKSQHTNDVEIGKLISKKGHGHMLNPQKDQSKGKSLDLNKKLDLPNQHQDWLKVKYDNFQTKNKNYKQFFKNLKNEEDNYGQFFNNLKHNQTSQIVQPQNKRPQRLNTFQKYDSKEMPTPKITSREYEYGLTEKSRTIQIQNNKKKPYKQQKNQFDSWQQQELLKNYQPPNYPKKSLQSQFREEHNLSTSLNSSIIYQNYEHLSSLNSSRKTQTIHTVESNQNKSVFQKQSVRKFNPTNLSHVIGSGPYNFKSDSLY